MASLLSLLALAWVYIFILVCAPLYFSIAPKVLIIIQFNIRWRIRNLPRFQWQLIEKPMDLLIVRDFFLSQWIERWTSYQLSLFAADTLQAIGGVLNFKWVQDGEVKVGSYCDAQGGVHF